MPDTKSECCNDKIVDDGFGNRVCANCWKEQETMTDNEIHDKTDKQHWSSNVENWKREFNDGDVVIGQGYGSFRTMVMVHEIDFDAPNDNVVHRGVFWEETEARIYADTLVGNEPK